MKYPLYRQALKQSWQFTWRNKMLWIFGFFAAVLGQMGLMEFLTQINFSLSNAVYDQDSYLGQAIYLVRGNGFHLPVDGWVWLLWLIIICLGFLAFLVFIAVVSQGTLIHSVSQSMKTGKAPNIDKAWYAGIAHFWKLLGINIFRKMITLALTIVLGWAAFMVLYNATGADLFVFFILFALVTIVGAVISFLVIYTASYVVIDEDSVVDASLKAWRLFTGHWLVSIEVGAMLIFMQMLMIVLAIVGLILFFIPAALIWFVAILTASHILFLVGFIVGGILFLTYITLLGSLFTVFSTTTWTYLFMRMHHEGVKSRLLHWFGHRQ